MPISEELNRRILKLHVRLQLAKRPVSGCGAARMAKDQQRVEAVLRDKDPECYQAQNGGYSESTGTIRRVRSGKEAVILIARQARTRWGDSGRQDVHNSDRRGNSKGRQI